MKYQRLYADLEALANIGRAPSGGQTRRAYSTLDLAARRWLGDRMAEGGLTVRLDAAANVIGLLPSVGSNDGRAVVIGSHIDTVPNGGRLDGALGVLAGLEVTRRLQESNAIRKRPLEIIAFEDEEGRFGAFTGSRAMMGELDSERLSQMRDSSGISLAAALEEAGLSINEFPKAARSIDEIGAYLELHVEQGPVLERKRLSIGIVEAIAGQVRYSVRFEGRPDHAGSTPMDERKDAFAAAALFAVNLRERVIKEGGGRAVMTIGIVKVEPTAGNIVPALARLGLEMRDTDGGRLERLAALLLSEAEVAAAAHGVGVQARRIFSSEPVPMNDYLRATLTSAAQHFRYECMVMPSQAGHDAQVLGRHVPAAMIFVPSKGGRSHCPEEATDWSDIERGVDVLYEATARLLSVG